MPKPTAIKDYRITYHARQEVARRQISEKIVAGVLSSPGQSKTVRQGRKFFSLKSRWLTHPKPIYSEYLLMLIVIYQKW
jgi:hypothetical protein